MTHKITHKITHANGKTMYLNNGLLTGDTYEFKNEIKSDFRGQWDAERKAWLVNEAAVLAKIENAIFTSRLSKMTVEPGDSVHVSAKAHRRGLRTGTYADHGWCALCCSYCWGDCQAN